MNLRASMLLAGLLAGAAHGQTAASTTAPSAAQSGSGTRSGAAPTRATGLPPTSPALSGTSASTGPLANANGNTTGNPALRGGSSGKAGAKPAGNRANGAGRGGAQKLPPAPAADASVQVIGFPGQNATGSVDHPLLPIVTDGNSLGIRSGTPIQVRLRNSIDSGHVRNGATVFGTLAAPIAKLPIGTPVRLTVVSSSPAGQLTSYGTLSIQVTSIDDHNVLSDTITAEGKEGAKDLPDSAPARGTEAIFSADQTFTLPTS